jgi:type IX secretion system PorP/SprF family membrane protein
MSMKRSIVIRLLLLVCSTLPLAASAQDIHFSQFWMAPLNYDPSVAGSQELRGVLNYKNQWGSVSVPYKTYNAAFDMQLKKKKASGGFWGAGIDISSDKAGDGNMGTTQLDLSGAYHLPLSDHSMLHGGVMAGIGQRSINYSSLQWGNQYDGMSFNPALNSGETGSSAFIFPDLGAGASWSYGKKEAYISGHDKMELNAGVSYFHINRPRYSFTGSGERLYSKLVVYGSSLLEIKNTNYGFVPGFMFSMQGPAKELVAGTMIRYTLQESSRYTGLQKESSFSIGVYYRNRDALIATMLVEMNRYALGVSYDYNTSTLKAATTGRGGFEIALRIRAKQDFIRSSHSQF